MWFLLLWYHRNSYFSIPPLVCKCAIPHWNCLGKKKLIYGKNPASRAPCSPPVRKAKNLQTYGVTDGQKDVTSKCGSTCKVAVAPLAAVWRASFKKSSSGPLVAIQQKKSSWPFGELTFKKRRWHPWRPFAEDMLKIAGDVPWWSFGVLSLKIAIVIDTEYKFYNFFLLYSWYTSFSNIFIGKARKHGSKVYLFHDKSKMEKLVSSTLLPSILLTIRRFRLKTFCSGFIHKIY